MFYGTYVLEKCQSKQSLIGKRKIGANLIKIHIEQLSCSSFGCLHRYLIAKEVIKIVGEIVVKVVSLGNNTQQYAKPYKLTGGIATDLDLHCEDGTVFHICGNNDWGYLALEILEPITKYAKKAIRDIKERIANTYLPEIIFVDDVIYRNLDIYFKSIGEKEITISGVPVLKEYTDRKGIRFSTEQRKIDTEELPFT